MAHFEKSNEWDIRFNISENYDTDNIIYYAKKYYATGTLIYIHVSDVEVGEREEDQITGEGVDSMGKEHVHIALVCKEEVCKSSVLSAFQIGKSGITGYYCGIRDTALTYKGWMEYHRKTKTKVNHRELLYREGKFPKDIGIHTQPRTHAQAIQLNERELKQQERDNVRLAETRKLRLLCGKRDFAAMDDLKPGFQSSAEGTKMKARVFKTLRDAYNKTLKYRCNYIVWGDTGTGKTRSMQHLFPNRFPMGNNVDTYEDYDVMNPDHEVVHFDETGSGDNASTNYNKLIRVSDLQAYRVHSKLIPNFLIRPKMILATMNTNPLQLCEGNPAKIKKLLLHFKIIHISKWLKMHDLELGGPKGVRNIIDADSLSDGSTSSLDMSTDDSEEEIGEDGEIIL